MNYESISSEKISIGHNTFIHPSAIIKGLNGKAHEIVIGDNCYIGENVQIIVDNFYLGDYSKIHHHTNIHGYKPCKVGHNAWIGQYTIIDSIGGVNIGNNFGVGAHSQLWSHIKYGDTLEGCRFLSDKRLNIGDDVWLVGHCIISPVNIAAKAMVMVGSVVTKDLEYNKIYAGSPAKDLTEKLGPQFKEVPIEEKLTKMKAYLRDSGCNQDNKIQIVSDIKQINFEDDISYFNVTDRKYKKTLLPSEIKFMQYLLPEKAKFIPYE